MTSQRMLALHVLTMRNFMSYGNNITTIQLDQPGTTFVVGKDMDNTTNGTSSNGCGKSSCINAIVYCLYNRAMTDDVTVDGLVNNINNKNMEVTLDFSIGDDCYRVVRARKMKSGPSGNYVRFYHKVGSFDFAETDDMSKGNSVYDTDADIERVIGMKYDMFMRIVVFSAMKESFFSLPLRSHGTSKKANQTDFIEELFGLTELSATAEALKLKMKDTTKALSDEKLRIEYQQREYARYQSQVESAKNRVRQWEDSRLEQISALESTLTHYAAFDFNAEFAKLNTLKELQSERVSLIQQQKSLSATVKQVLQAEERTKKELTALNSSICPYCDQSFHNTDHKISECEAALEESAKKANDLAEKMHQLVIDVQSVNDKLSAIESELSFDTLEEAQKVYKQIERGVEEIEKLRTSVNPFVSLLEELDQQPVPAPDFGNIDSLTKVIEHQDFLYKLLTKKDSFVRRNLLNRNLPYLNSKLQDYLEALGLPHKVIFTHELTAKITEFGRELAFGNLSAGQKARVNLALSLAFRDVLQAMHMPVNICLLDEVLDVGLNATGARMAISLLKRKAREEKLSLYVISHREEIDSSFDRIMQVQMSKRFSYIFFEDGGGALTND